MAKRAGAERYWVVLVFRNTFLLSSPSIAMPGGASLGRIGARFAATPSITSCLSGGRQHFPQKSSHLHRCCVSGR